MEAIVDVQYASSEPNLPSRHQLTDWVNAALRVHTIGSKESETKEQNDVQVSHPPSPPTLSSPQVELTIRIVDEEEAKQLNKKWRQRPNPTNILSFPFESPLALEIPLLGDLVICAPIVAREATSQQKRLDAHWTHLVIHGTLHLLGYDHIEQSQAQLMESSEIRILYDLGYPDPYQLNSL
jgi:probable rRNA maturation factor